MRDTSAITAKYKQRRRERTETAVSRLRALRTVYNNIIICESFIKARSIDGGGGGGGWPRGNECYWDVEFVFADDVEDSATTAGGGGDYSRGNGVRAGEETWAGSGERCGRVVSLKLLHLHKRCRDRGGVNTRENPHYPSPVFTTFGFVLI